MRQPLGIFLVGLWILPLALPIRADIVLAEEILAGGGAPSMGPTYSLQTTLGQANIGKTSGPGYLADTGFWDQREHIALCPWNDNNVGNCVLTLTDEGTIGFFGGPDGPGTGFVYPAEEINRLYIGGLWVGNSQSYVANRDYVGDPTQEWLVATNPDGHVWIDATSDLQQDVHAAFTDSAAVTPLGLRADLETWGFAVNSVAIEMVILKYTLQNVGSLPLTNLYAGLLLDYDLEPYTENTGSTVEDGNLIYLTSAGNPFVGLQLLQDVPGYAPPLSNLSFIRNPEFVWPLGYVPEADKFDFLSAADPTHIVTEAPEPDDYGVMASAGPFDLAPGETYTVAFTIVGGADLDRLREHALVAQMIWEDGIMAADPRPPDERDLVTRLMPAAPNPFTQRTLVQFNLRRPGKVDVGIYDTNGRLVRTLARGHHPAMRYAITWDGRNQDDHLVSAGVYFIRLLTEDQRDTQRVICIR